MSTQFCMVHSHFNTWFLRNQTLSFSEEPLYLLHLIVGLHACITDLLLEGTRGPATDLPPPTIRFYNTTNVVLLYNVVFLAPLFVIISETQIL